MQISYFIIHWDFYYNFSFFFMSFQDFKIKWKKKKKTVNNWDENVRETSDIQCTYIYMMLCVLLGAYTYRNVFKKT